MRYVKNRSHFSKRTSSRTRWLPFLLGLFVVVIVIGVVIGVMGEEEIAETTQEQFVEEIEEVGTVMAVLEEKDWTQEITLSAVDGSGSTALSRRGVSDGVYTHVIVATLPVIDTTTYFYEGWLVQPGVVDFFSTGEMFMREDGKWGLVWEVNVDEGDDDLLDHREVVITLEERDGNDAPSPHHVVEGVFEGYDVLP